MSRRSHRHGDRGHVRPPRLEPGRPSGPGPGPTATEAAAAPDRPTSVVVAPATVPFNGVASSDVVPEMVVEAGPTEPTEPIAPAADVVDRLPQADDPLASPPPGVAPGPPIAPVVPGGFGPPDAGRAGCTSPQLRRFIKSRAYIPMHELRRRFAIEGPEDEVAAIDVDGTRLYVGLPEREGRLLAELLRGGDVGAELSHDPVTPVIVGVYPMRPVPRS